MDDEIDIAQCTGRFGNRGRDGLHDSALGRLRCGQHLGGDAPLGCIQCDISEGSADVDSQADFFAHRSHSISSCDAAKRTRFP